MSEEDDFRERMRRDGALSEFLAEHIWNLHRPLTLAGEQFEVIGGEDVPGYEDDDSAVLLRRMPDGQVFEADLDVTVRPVRPPLTPEQQAELSGQLVLPGVVP